MTPLCCPIGHAAGTASVVAHDGWTLAPWPSSLPSELAGSNPALASSSRVAAGGDRWLLMAVRGHLGDTQLGTLVLCSPGARRPGIAAWYGHDLLIRSHGRTVTVQTCPGVAAPWGNVPGLSSFLGSWPRSWHP